MKGTKATFAWADGFRGAVTICDNTGVIVYMNGTSQRQFEKYGGASLLGTNLLDCHPANAREKLVQMLKVPHENIYTTEKGGVKRLVMQSPWMVSGEFWGIIEISFEIPAQIPNFIRD